MDKEEKVEKALMIDKETGNELTVADMIPETAELKINDKIYMLKRYSLRAKTYFIQKYGIEGFVQKLISKCAEIVYSEIAFYLMDDTSKKDFNHNFDTFQDAFINPQAQTDMVEAVKKAMGQSKLIIMSESEYKEWLKEKKNDEIINEFEYWRNNVHVLCKAYGWTRDYVLSLTEGEIYQHLYEIKKENIETQLNEHLTRYKGVEQVLRMENDNPVKMLYMKYKKRWEKDDETMLKGFADELKKDGYTFPGGH